MKQIIVTIVLVFTVAIVEAQTDSAGTKYQYYPDVNVYYNDVNQTYWYFDTSKTQWKNAAQLPPSYTLDGKSKKNSFYYNGGNVWEKNAEHIKAYGKKTRLKKSSN